MTTVILFHHAQGLTPGIGHFADRLRAGGHEVVTPDLYEGATFDTLDAGIAHASDVGFDVIVERGEQAAAALPDDVVYGGFSLGVMPAQKLAQTKPGAKGVLMYHACIPAAEFGGWPEGLRAQIHAMTKDPYFAGEDAAASRELVELENNPAEKYLYPGKEHLFTDDSLATFDPDMTDLVVEHTLEFLELVERSA